MTPHLVELLDLTKSLTAAFAALEPDDQREELERLYEAVLDADDNPRRDITPERKQAVWYLIRACRRVQEETATAPNA